MNRCRCGCPYPRICAWCGAAYEVDPPPTEQAVKVLERYDDGSHVEFWGYAGGGSKNGAWSEVTLAKRSEDGSTEVMRYTIVGREPGPSSAELSDSALAQAARVDCLGFIHWLGDWIKETMTRPLTLTEINRLRGTLGLPPLPTPELLEERRVCLAEAVLLFYSGTDWNRETRERWHYLTGSDEATTVTLSNLARSCLIDPIKTRLDD